jgi:hypothetical protein
MTVEVFRAIKMWYVDFWIRAPCELVSSHPIPPARLHAVITQKTTRFMFICYVDTILVLDFAILAGLPHLSLVLALITINRNIIVSVQRYCNPCLVRFQVLTAASMKIRTFWDIAPCILVGVDRHFRGAYFRPDDGESTYL